MSDKSDDKFCTSLLIVEDEKIISGALKKILISMGYEISGVFSSGEAALEHLESHQPQLIMMDIHLDGEMDGIQTSRILKKRYNIPVVYLTADTEDETFDRVKKTSPYGYILKPFTKESLKLGIEIAVYRHKIELELEERNQDLDAFTYSVSHDLKAPVRNITRYAEMLLNEFPDISDMEKKEYISRILYSSGIMNDMIRGFLALSGAGRTNFVYEKVCLSDIAKDILKNLSESEPERDVAVLIQPEICVTGDSDMLSIAMENLLGNAWKYSGKEEKPVIRFGRLDDGNTCYVKDNGIGFDMEKSEDLFKPFKRNCSDSSFSGIGIGLATVKRIISRHKGRIWCESRPGEGATFYFQV